MKLSCKLSQIIFATHILMMGFCEQFTPKTAFLESLNPVQKEAYKRIAKRRLLVYLFGGLFGVIFINFFEQQICPQALSILAIQMLYYMIYPWPEKMADHLETPTQRKLWKNVNKYMQQRYTTALFIGILAIWLQE
tara:strand:+ start:7327 stop:7734 length:408 start_codon:yes stop_codon:yes gene_type:complete